MSSGNIALDMVGGMLASPSMSTSEKLEELRELSLEKVHFASPAEALRLVSGLASIAANDSNPAVRAAALAVMGRMMDLEEKEEAAKDIAHIDWHSMRIALKNPMDPRNKEFQNRLDNAAQGLAPQPSGKAAQETDEEGMISLFEFLAALVSHDPAGLVGAAARSVMDQADGQADPPAVPNPDTPPDAPAPVPYATADIKSEDDAKPVPGALDASIAADVKEVTAKAAPMPPVAPPTPEPPAATDG